MRSDPDCLLTPALRKLLQSCLDAADADENALATKLCLSKSTINKQFHAIYTLLGVHSKSAAIVLALQKEWITLPPLTDNGK